MRTKLLKLCSEIYNNSKELDKDVKTLLEENKELFQLFETFYAEIEDNHINNLSDLSLYLNSDNVNLKIHRLSDLSENDLVTYLYTMSKQIKLMENHLNYIIDGIEHFKQIIR